MLAKATIEQKDAAIGLLKERVVLQGQMIKGRLFSEPAIGKEEPDTEEILGGAIEIKNTREKVSIYRTCFVEFETF